MNDDNIHIVVKRESHWLPTCQCDSCIAERKRRSSFPSSPIKCFSVDTAYHLGFISTLTPSGSLARQLFEDQ